MSTAWSLYFQLSVIKFYSHPWARYHAAVRVSPVLRSTSARQPVSWVRAADEQTQPGARNSFALSADNNVARPAILASEPIAASTPRASAGGMGRTTGFFCSARPTASTRPRVEVDWGWAA